MWVEDASPTGRMILLLDEVMDRLMESGPHKVTDALVRARYQGEALGLARAIRECSFLATVDDVREYAMYRWEARQEGLEPLSAVEWGAPE